MKILHLPVNVASQISQTVDALRRLGVDAKGLAWPAMIQSRCNIEILQTATTRGWFERVRAGSIASSLILRRIAWADVVHWYFAPGLPFGVDVGFASLLGKKGVVEFWGSDIRRPLLECRENRWYEEVWKEGEYEYRAAESDASSRLRQRSFARFGVHALVPSRCMGMHLYPECFPSWRLTSQRLDLESIEVRYPDPQKKRALVVHAPTAPHAKGTRYVIAAVEALKKQFDFEFKLIEGVTPERVRALSLECDIFVDQLILGEYGLAAIEAMAIGKPVICFLKESCVASLRSGCPIVNANPSTVEGALEQLLSTPVLRHELGRRGRAFVEEHHSAETVARQLLEIYRSL